MGGLGPFQGQRQQDFEAGSARLGFTEGEQFVVIRYRRVVRTNRRQAGGSSV